MRTDDDEAPSSFPVAGNQNIDPRAIVLLRDGTNNHWYHRDGGDPSVLRRIPGSEVHRMLQTSVLEVDMHVSQAQQRMGRAIRPRPRHQSASLTQRPTMANPPSEAPPAEAPEAEIPAEYHVTYNRQHYALPFAGNPPPPPAGSTGLDTSRVSTDNALDEQRREVERAMAEVRHEEQRLPEPRTEPVTFAGTVAAAYAQSAQDRGTHYQASRTLEILSVAPQHTSRRAPGTNIRQDVIDTRRRRFKTPARDFMAAADEASDSLPNGVYLRMANAAKKMYEIIEELDPTTVEGYTVVGENVEFMSPEQRIAELEEKSRNLEIDLSQSDDHIQNQTIEIEKLREKFTDMVQETNRRIHRDTMTQRTISTYMSRMSILTTHPVIGIHIAHSNVMKSVRAGTDLLAINPIRNGFRLKRKWDALRSGVWNRRSFIIESIKYDKNDYTEGFGAAGISLDEFMKALA